MNSPFAKVKSSFLMVIFQKFAIWDATELSAGEARCQLYLTILMHVFREQRLKTFLNYRILL
jgi:hypothetical protein